jgi:hypothetical protein
MLFLCIKFLLMNKDDAPESIIAEREIVRERPWNIIGIFRCCPFTPETDKEEMENDEDEIKEEILFWMYMSVALALYPDFSKNPSQTCLLPGQGLLLLLPIWQAIHGCSALGPWMVPLRLLLTDLLSLQLVGLQTGRAEYWMLGFEQGNYCYLV